MPMHEYRTQRIVLTAAAVIAVLSMVGCDLARLLRGSSPPPEPQRGLAVADLDIGTVEVVAEGLDVPWDIAFLPDGSLLVSERPGRLLLLTSDGNRQVLDVPEVHQVGEGGLMGLALHPDFGANRWLYVCLTTESEERRENRVERYRFYGGQLAERQIIIGGMPAASRHDGCRLGFGPDGNLYITMGDVGEQDLARDLGSLAGKILRLTADGSVPAENPFGTPVYSYGHRNPQGLVWDEEGRLWSTEHGRSGFKSGLDEINLIEAGKNYGWPVIEGDETAPGMEAPFLHSGPDYTWAPAGVAYWNGRLFFGGLRGEALYEVLISERGAASLRAHFHSDFGRIRAVRLGPDGMLYFSTSNRDHRARLREGDDKILRVDPIVFQR